MFNKPRGTVTTASDEKGRQTVHAFLGPESALRDLPWVAPVGRLDKASEGLLLLTNDSEWAARVLAPETHLDKTYHVQIGTIADVTVPFTALVMSSFMAAVSRRTAEAPASVAVKAFDSTGAFTVGSATHC